MLVDLERLDLRSIVEILEDGDELEEVHGVWGMADGHVGSHGEGDMDVLGDALVVGQVPPNSTMGRHGWATRVVDATGAFAGALTAMEEEDLEFLEEEGLTVRSSRAWMRRPCGCWPGCIRRSDLADDCDGECR